MNLLKEMLLIEEPSVFRLYKEMTDIATYFVAPVFTIALILEYFGEMDFGGLVKKLFLVTVFIGAFYQFHTKAVEISLESATYTLKKVSPRNLFIKKWYYSKVKTKDKSSWNIIQSIAIPNLNDLLATAFFLLSKVFIWLLKLIYSSVYHLTYVFSGITAILYFLGWTKDALKGTVQASLWCMAMPFVIVSILALVGNSIDDNALHGELLVAKVDTIIWLFGVTLLLLISPVISYGMIKGDGIHSFGSKMGAMVVSSGMKTMALAPIIAGMKERFSGKSVLSRLQGNRYSSNNKRSTERGNTNQFKEKQGKDQFNQKSQKSQDSRTKETQSQAQFKSQKEERSLQGSKAPQATIKAQPYKGNISVQKMTSLPQKIQVANQPKSSTQKQIQSTRQVTARNNKEFTSKSETKKQKIQTQREVKSHKSPRRDTLRRKEHGLQ